MSLSNSLAGVGLLLVFGALLLIAQFVFKFFKQPKEISESAKDDGKLDEIRVHSKIDLSLKVIYGLIQSGLLLLGFTHEGFDLFGEKVPLWAFLLPIQCAHLFSTFLRRRIEVSQTASRFFLGWPIRDELPPGPAFDPPGFGYVYDSRPTKIEQVQLPAEPEKVFKGTDDEYDNLAPDQKDKFKRPIRIVTGYGSGDDPLESRMVLEWSGVLQFVVKKVTLWRARFGHLTHEEAVAEAFRLLRDTFESTLTNQVKDRSPSWIIKNIHEIQKAILEAILAQVYAWGIEIVKCELMSPDLGETVSKALRAVPAARLELQKAGPAAEALAIATERAGKAEAFVTEKKGLATASARQAMIEAETVAIAQQADKLKVPAEAVLGFQGGQTLAQGDNSIILGSEGIAQVFGLGKLVAKQIGDEKKKGATT